VQSLFFFLELNQLIVVKIFLGSADKTDVILISVHAK